MDSTKITYGSRKRMTIMVEFGILLQGSNFQIEVAAERLDLLIRKGGQKHAGAVPRVLFSMLYLSHLAPFQKLESGENIHTDGGDSNRPFCLWREIKPWCDEK